MVAVTLFELLTFSATRVSTVFTFSASSNLCTAISLSMFLKAVYLRYRRVVVSSSCMVSLRGYSVVQSRHSKSRWGSIDARYGLLASSNYIMLLTVAGIGDTTYWFNVSFCGETGRLLSGRVLSSRVVCLICLFDPRRDGSVTVQIWLFRFSTIDCKKYDMAGWEVCAIRCNC